MSRANLLNHPWGREISERFVNRAADFRMIDGFKAVQQGVSTLRQTGSAQCARNFALHPPKRFFGKSLTQCLCGGWARGTAQRLRRVNSSKHMRILNELPNPHGFRFGEVDPLKHRMVRIK